MENLSIRMQDRRPDEKPYEKFMDTGPESLTDVELLAVLLRSGTREMDVLTLSALILNGNRSYEGLASLMHYTFEELKDIKGIGKVKAIQILCLGELVKRIWRSTIAKDSFKMDSASACAAYYTQELRYLEQEELRVAYLDARMRLIKDYVMTRGTADASLVSIRDILERAFRHHATNVLIVHNHPYGEPLPSNHDHLITKAVSEGTNAAGLKLLDHIIIGEAGFYSFKERGFID